MIMKDSGIEWIGQIPSHWEVRKFKYQHNGSNTGEGIDKVFWTSDEQDDYFYTAGQEPIHSSYADFPNWKYTQDNDLLLARNGTPYVYIPYNHAIYSDHIIRTIVKPNIDKRFVRHALQQSITYTIVDTVSIITWSMSIWNNQKLPFPPLSEQQAIADYLDEQCAKIDGAVEKQKQIIEKLKEYKKSLITETVTKGLNPNTPMKDSGIEWIGQIPSHWETKKIKYLFQLRDEKNCLPLKQVNLISLYTDKGVLQHADIEETTGNKAQNADGYKLVYKGDIIVNIILCWMGAIGFSAYNGVTSPAYDIYKPLLETNSKYYHYLFRTSGFSGECYKVGRGIMLMRWRTYSDQFKSIYVSVPPLSEQQAIADYLDEQCAKIDSVIEKREKMIDLLSEYKKSLIYECVTGKKEVA